MRPQEEQFYQNNITTAQNQIRLLSRRLNRFAFLRLSLIIGGGFALFQVIQLQHVALTLLTLTLVSILFLWSVYLQSRVAKSKESYERFLQINDNEIYAAKRRDNNIYHNGVEFTNDQHLYSSDLDIYGPSSLFHLINRCSTSGGIATLASWLGSPSAKNEIEERQEFIKELREEYGLWQQLQAQLVFSLKDKIDYKKTIERYLSLVVPIPQHSLFKGFVKMMPYLMLLLLIGSFVSSKILAVFIIVGLINLLVSIFFAGRVNLVAAQVNKAGDALSSFSYVFKAIEGRSWRSKLPSAMLRDIQQKNNHSISVSIKSLSKILERLDLRLNMFVGTFLNIFLLWDLRQVFALEEWKATQSAGIADAFDLLSVFEAIGSMTVLSFNRPEWTFPRISDEKHTLHAVALAHPFISDSEVVVNDYSLVNHRLALITGSNMAGKSTFLRTIGINAVLAYAGAPVNAQSMEISIMQMVTYMRIRDSINESTSTFKAELNRIKLILEEVTTTENTFFLLDEMLRGTNSVDKYLGSKAIIERLIKQRAVGMVATHDLKLSDLSEVYPDYVRNYHFDIQIHGEEMHFDYLLKDGPCTIFNASLLLKKIGIII